MMAGTCVCHVLHATNRVMFGMRGDKSTPTRAMRLADIPKRPSYERLRRHARLEKGYLPHPRSPVGRRSVDGFGMLS